MNKNKIVFFGTPHFAAHTLDELFKNSYDIAGVVTKKDSAVQAYCQQNKLSIVELGDLKDLKAEVGVLFAYGTLVPNDVLKNFAKGIVNIHPSLLPKYRGPSPVQTSLLNGDKKTGVSIMVLDDKMDHGPIVAQKQVAITKDERADQLHDRLAHIGTELLIEKLPDYLSGSLQPQAQDGAKATFSKTIKRADGEVDWSKNAQEIYNQFRAFYPWPGIFSHWGKKRLKLVKIEPLNSDFKDKIGEIFEISGVPAVKCGQSAIKILELQLEGKNTTSGQDFVKGYNTFVGSLLS